MINIKFNDYDFPERKDCVLCNLFLSPTLFYVNEISMQILSSGCRHGRRPWS